jgi:site-specific DNA-methyltransferase (adenine-specific)
MDEVRGATPENAERSTPWWLFDLLHKEFEFTLDACASPENAKCKTWLGRQCDGRFVDGLTAPWMDPDGRRTAVFCNPPYSRGQLRLWLAKAHAERERGATVVLLIPGDRSTKAWQRHVPGEEVRDLSARVDYEVGAGAKFASAVVVLRPREDGLPWTVTPPAPLPRPYLERLAALERRAYRAEAKADALARRVESLKASLTKKRRARGKDEGAVEVRAAADHPDRGDGAAEAGAPGEADRGPEV